MLQYTYREHDMKEDECMKERIKTTIYGVLHERSIEINIHRGILAVSLLSALICAILGYSVLSNCVLAIISIVLSLYAVYVYRHHLGLFIAMVFIAYTNYSVAGVYLFPDIRITLYQQFTDLNTYGIGIMCIVLFEWFLLVFAEPVVRAPRSIETKSSVTEPKCEYNRVIAYACLIAYVALFLLIFRYGENGERAESSPILEYRILLAIAGGYYSRNKKHMRVLWTVVILVTSVLTFYGGNRVNTFASLIFLLVFWYSKWITYKVILALLPVAIVGMAAVGFLRADFSLTWENIAHTLGALWDDKLTYEGAIYGYLPSLSTIELAGQIPLGEKMTLLFQHIAYIFFGGTIYGNPDLSMYSREYYTHYWGFVSPSYFYFWIGYLGPIVLAFLTQFYIRMTRHQMIENNSGRYSSALKAMISYFFISSVARWYVYGPMQLLRGVFVAIVAMTLAYAGDYVTRKWMPKLCGDRAKQK